MISAGLWAIATLTATTPERVLVVVNDESALSVRIGQMYAQRRQVPAKNICHLRTSPAEEIRRAKYAAEIEQPIAAHLKREKLDGIHYLVLTQGVPLRIRAESQTGTVSSDGASVDSELTLLYGRLRGRAANWRGPAPNPYYRQRETPFDAAVFGMYLVTRLAAYDYATVERMVAKAQAAIDPRTNGHGKVVIDLRSGDDEEGNDWLRTATLLLPAERVVADQTRMVITNVKDALGLASWGSNDRNRTARFLSFQWLPGALATAFVSSDGRTFEKPPPGWTLGSWNKPEGWFNGTPQSLTADLIEEGATGASGHVDEPFLQYCPRPELLFPAYVLEGRNLAEAFWTSIPSVSWMNIVVGDPLCRLAPGFGKRPIRRGP